MDIYRTAEFGNLTNFINWQESMAIVERIAPQEAAHFFQALMQQVSFGVAGIVNQDTAAADIKAILQYEIPVQLQTHPFYEHWVLDMAEICKQFCVMYQSSDIGFWLGSKRGCRRYHVDRVKLRALVTYAGKGTEYLPDEAADRRAFETGEPNEKILKDPVAIRFVNVWDVAVFRGGAKGVLHRTPDAALQGSSILMRLDEASFWRNA